MNNTPRAMRRHHLDRMKAKANRVFRDSWGYGKGGRIIDGKDICKHANNMKTCQHPGCCNPRRHFGTKTRQELWDDIEMM